MVLNVFTGQTKEIYESIKKKINFGKYASGQPLPEVQLAESYGAKLSRIRQILQELENDGLVEKILGRGSFVRSITPESLQELFELREALEVMAVRLTTRWCDKNELKKIVALFEDVAKPSIEEELECKVELGLLLHGFIRKSCGNSMIIEVLEKVELQTKRVWRKGLAIEGRINQAFLEHKKLLEFIRIKDKRSAEELMQKHITNALTDYLAGMMRR